MELNGIGVNRATFVSGEVRPTHDRGAIGAVQLLLLLILSVAVSGWAACTPFSRTEYGFSAQQCQSRPSTLANVVCSGFTSCGHSGNCYLQSGEGETCNINTAGYWVNCVVCANSCQRDSVQCEIDGGQWVDDPSQSCGKKCQTCPNDTTWTESQCAYSSSRGLYLNIVNTYSIVNCVPSTETNQYYSPQCDSSAKDSTWQCIGSVDGVNVMLRSPKGRTINCEADGSCPEALRKIAAGECGDNEPPPNSSESSPNSSSSDDGSSSSDGGSSSSDGGSSDSGNSSGSNDWEQWMKDSLHEIRGAIEWSQPLISGIYDGVYEIAGTAHEMNQNLIGINSNTDGILEKSEQIDDKLTTTNNLLNDLKNKNWSPNISVTNNTDVTGIQDRQDQTRDTLHNTNSLLEQISNKLNGLGNDTFHVDTSKAPASIDSALKHWGNRNNHTFGAAGLDSAGWGAEVNRTTGYSDSVTASTAGLDPIAGCDTSGGKKCDGTYLGSNGLSSASTQYKGLYGSLGDSLTNGAFADSLGNWASKFSHSRLTGAGSDNCPSILERTWSVPIGNVNMAFGPIGKYICTPIFGGLNAFALARTLLRAIVAIACMWFLFKCATGFKGQGGEDDD